MGETVTAERGNAASGADDDRDLKSFPLRRTRAATVLMARSRIVRSLPSGSPAFRLLMFGSSISMLGTRISTVAFPMLVLHINNSPLIAGLVTFGVIAPSMIAYVPVGVLVDRWNPRRVMLCSEFMRGLAIILVVAALIKFRMQVSISFLMLMMVAEEIFEIFSTLADRRYMNRVMERDRIDSQQAYIEVRTHAAVLAGRPIGPFLFSIYPFLPFLVDTVSFFVSWVSLLMVKRIDEPPRKTRRLRLTEAVSDIGNGFGWLKGDLRARYTILLMSMTSMVAQALILIFLVEAHSKQLSTIAIGIVLAASGAGGVVGSYCSRIVKPVVRRSWLSIQMVAWSAVFVLLALAGGRSPYWSAGAMFFLSLTGAIGNVEFGSYLVRNVADDMIAKVTGISQMLTIGACGIGPVIGGYAVQRFEVNGAIWILFGIVMLMAIISLLMPEERRQAVQIVRSIRRSLQGAGLTSQADSPVPEHVQARSFIAHPERNRHGGRATIKQGDPVLFQAKNGRP